jgi:hypothetical protein
MRAPTNPADEPNIDTRSVQLARVSEAARALAAAHAAEQRSGSTTSSNLSVRANSATSYISLVPARDRLLDPDVRLASVSPLERRSSLAVVGFVGFVLSVALTAVLAKVRFPLAETWSQPALHRTIELSSLSAPVASALRAEPAISRLIVQSSHGMSGEPAPLGLSLHGPAEGAVVIITGLLPGMDLSTGDAFGADAWRVHASDLQYAWIAPPESFVGSADLVAELRLPDDKIADRQVIHFEWLPAISLVPAQRHLGRDEILYREEITTVSPISPAIVQQAHQEERTEVAPISPAPAQRQFDQEEIASAGANSTLRTFQGSASSDTASKENALEVPAFKGVSQENTRKAARSQERRRMAAEADPWRGDRADFWIARRYPKDDNPRAPSAAAYARKGTHALKGFWDWSR